jgi:hypothetical protein
MLQMANATPLMTYDLYAAGDFFHRTICQGICEVHTKRSSFGL